MTDRSVVKSKFEKIALYQPAPTMPLRSHFAMRVLTRAAGLRRAQSSRVSPPELHSALCPAVLLALLVGVLPLAGCSDASKAGTTAAKPPEVVVEKPIVREVTDFEEFSGRTEAVAMVEVRARVTGYLDKICFKDGADVKKGDVLFEIDPRTYKAELGKAAAQVEQNKAHLSRLDNDLERGKTLFQHKVITQEGADRLVFDRAETQAMLEAAKAARDSAALNVGFTRVIAPLSGRISRRNVDPGSLIKADETPLTTIVALDPLYAYFDIDERTLLRLRRLEAEGKIKATSGSESAVLVGLADEEGFSLRGWIDFVDNKLDPNMGTLRIRAVIPNPKHVLAPGLFVRMRLPIGNPHPATLIPEEAIGSDQGQKFVYVVNANDEAVYRRVTIGPLEEGRRVIESGIAADDRVVVNGLQRVRPGAKVTPSLIDQSSAPPTGKVAEVVRPSERASAQMTSRGPRTPMSAKR